ncbi:MAG: cohesin domain-containing protein [Vicinamibacterales bacterium]
MRNRRQRWVVLGLVVLMTAGCATGRAVKNARSAADRGDWDTAVAYYRQALAKEPSSVEYRIALDRAVRMASTAHMERARQLEAQDQLGGAMAEYKLAADLDPSNTQALTKAVELDRRIREQLDAARGPSRLEQLQQQAAASSPIPRLDPRQRVPLLNFPNAAIRDILTAIGSLTGINIIIDRDAQSVVSQGFSIQVQDVPVEEALNQVLSANGLTFKITNPNTIFVYQDTPNKRAQFDDVYTQTFYVSHGDVNDIIQIINQMVTTGAVVRPSVTPNKNLNAVVVKATLPVLEAIKAVIDQNDKPRAEVLVETEILEVNRTRMRELGIDLSQYALGFTFSPELAPPNAQTTAGAFPAQPPPFNLNTISRGTSIADFYLTTPTALVRFLEQDQTTKVLAKSQLRGREGEQLSVRLGDIVPIPQQTTFQNVAGGGTVPLTSVQYTPVGLNLNFIPRVTFEDEIVLTALTLQNQALGNSIDVAGQSYPTIVERTATTALRLRDGESNLLAGLLLDQDRTTLRGVPGISQIPILRRLFGVSDSEAQQTDIVMIITPRIIRSHELKPEDLQPTYVGTSQNFGLGRVPSLIAPGTPPPQATVPLTGPPASGGGGGRGGEPPATNPAGQAGQAGAAQAGQAAQVTPPPVPVQVPPPATPPTTPPPAGENRVTGVVPVEPVTGDPMAPPQPQGAAEVSVTVGGEQLAGGPPFTVPVTLANASDVSAVTVTLTFDPAVVQVAGVSPGSLMDQGGVKSTFVPRMNPQAGRVDIAVARPGQTGATGTGLLAAVQLKGVSAGTAQIAVSAVATTASGQPVRVQAKPATVIIK